MSSVVTTGTIVFPASPSGTNQSIPIGAPVITATSTTGASFTYTEGSSKTFLVSMADAVVTVGFDAIASADMLYVGTDQPIDVKISGSATAIHLVAGGFIMIYKGAATAMTVQATTANPATVVVALMGA